MRGAALSLSGIAVSLTRDQTVTIYWLRAALAQLAMETGKKSLLSLTCGIPGLALTFSQRPMNRIRPRTITRSKSIERHTETNFAQPSKPKTRMLQEIWQLSGNLGNDLGCHASLQWKISLAKLGRLSYIFCCLSWAVTL